MASPQIENGFTKIANELLDALCCLQLSGHEWAVVHAVIRKTYGYNKKEDWMTNTQIMALTGQSQQKVSLAKKKLVEKNIVIENGNKTSVNKDYESWCRVTENDNSVIENGNKKLSKTVNTKESKYNITKDNKEEGIVDNSNTLVEKNAKVTDMADFNPLGAEIIHAMVNIDPKNKTYYGNKTQRAACDFLIEEYGLQETKNRILIINKTNGVPFFPTITTPVQLRDKWVQLEKAVERHKREAGSNSVVF
jgi:phage replication O-like protein O